jgi:hypothetical protein
MREKTTLEKAAGHAQDMTVADVHTVLVAVSKSLAEMAGRHHELPSGIIQGVGTAYVSLGRQLRRGRYLDPGRPRMHREKPLPETEMQVSSVGRRLRVLTRDWGEWATEWRWTLHGLLSMLDKVADGADVWVPGLFDAAQSARYEALHEHEARHEAEAEVKSPAKSPAIDPAIDPAWL